MTNSLCCGVLGVDTPAYSLYYHINYVCNIKCVCILYAIYVHKQGYTLTHINTYIGGYVLKCMYIIYIYYMCIINMYIHNV